MIGVVGGGVAGLAAAHRLQATGPGVTVFEAVDALGGLAAP
jgi:protoporphyrinogen oxidase